MKVGYVRISTREQNTARQDVLMEKLGVERVFTDKLRKRKDGKWLVTFPTGLYKENGKRDLIYKYCATQAEAVEAMRKSTSSSACFFVPKSSFRRARARVREGMQSSGVTGLN